MELDPKEKVPAGGAAGAGAVDPKEKEANGLAGAGAGAGDAPNDQDVLLLVVFWDEEAAEDGVVAEAVTGAEAEEMADAGGAALPLDASDSSSNNVSANFLYSKKKSEYSCE